MCEESFALFILKYIKDMGDPFEYVSREKGGVIPEKQLEKKPRETEARHIKAQMIQTVSPLVAAAEKDSEKAKTIVSDVINALQAVSEQHNNWIVFEDSSGGWSAHDFTEVSGKFLMESARTGDEQLDGLLSFAHKFQNKANDNK